jgi:hypothetical protein
MSQIHISIHLHPGKIFKKGDAAQISNTNHRAKELPLQDKSPVGRGWYVSDAPHVGARHDRPSIVV